jgi:hypothetical protein
MTPLAKLTSLPDAESFLKAGTTLNQLKAAATRLTDNQAANAVPRCVLNNPGSRRGISFLNPAAKAS